MHLKAKVVCSLEPEGLELSRAMVDSVVWEVSDLIWDSGWVTCSADSDWVDPAASVPTWELDSVGPVVSVLTLELGLVDPVVLVPTLELGLADPVVSVRM